MRLPLGKFSLDRCDLPTMLDNVAVILRMVTVGDKIKHWVIRYVRLEKLTDCVRPCGLVLKLGVLPRLADEGHGGARAVARSRRLVLLERLPWLSCRSLGVANLVSSRSSLEEGEATIMSLRAWATLRRLSTGIEEAMTINIDKRYTKRIPLIYYFIVFVAAAGYIYVYIFSMFWFVFIRCRETGDFAAAAVVFSLGTNSETCATKLLFMVINKDTVQGIVQRYLECDSNVVPGSRFSKNLRTKLRDVKKRVIIAWSSLILIGLAYVLRPFVLPGRHFTEDLYVIYGLEPMIETPNYEIASTFMTITICTGVYTLAGVTAFILVIIGYIEAQILALSDEMLTLWEDAEKHYENYIETNNINSSNNRVEGDSNINGVDHKTQTINTYINNRLKKIITFHITDINLLNDFEAVFRVTMAIEFGLIVVGIVSELLGGIENTYIELPYTFLQIYMDCYIGQKVIDASNIFEKAVYNCNWENFDKANMKIVLTMLQSSQKSLKLTAGGLAILDYVCLMAVIKSTYSFYTTLHSTIN
nr:uncharacterized protein LOC117991444 [Maniola hyperantus]